MTTTTFYRVYCNGDKVCETSDLKLAETEANEYCKMGYRVEIRKITE